MTAAELRSYTRKELAALAKKHCIPGWHPMRKEELVRVLVAATRYRKNESQHRNGRTKVVQSRRNRPAKIQSSNGKPQRKLLEVRDLSAAGDNGRQNSKWKNQIVARVCDPFWVLVQWGFSRDMIARAEAALGSEWHQARPVIRIYDVTSNETTNSMKVWVRDVEIHGGQDHWYIQVDDPAHSYQLHIGYLTPSDRFFALAHSESIQTSRDVSSRPLRRRSPLSTQNMSTLSRRHASDSDFEFRIDAELVVSGVTHPQAELTFSGVAVDLEQDGSFQFQLDLPNGRQLFPVVMITPNGREQRTIVLAVERNTKKLEPKVFDEL